MSCVTSATCPDIPCSQSTYVRCVNSTCSSLLNNCLDYNSSNDTSPDIYICVDNCRINCSCPLPDFTGFVSFNAVMLLAVVLPVIAVNTAILVALALESSIVKVIRLVLASILISGLLSSLGLAMFHLAGIILSQTDSYSEKDPFKFSPSPVNSPPSPPCTITVFLVMFGGAARLVFMATFSVVVYIMVKHGNANKKHLVVAVLVAVVVLWGIIFLGTSPLFSQVVVHTDYQGSVYCFPTHATPVPTYTFGGLYFLFFCVITLFITVIFLLIVSCNKRNITSATAVEKTMVKFGFFLLFGNGLNLIGLGVPGLLTLTGGLLVANDHERLFRALYTSFTLLNAGLILTPVLILTFFKPIRKKLLCWLCCRIAKKRKVKHNHNNNNNNNNNNGEGHMVTATI